MADIAVASSDQSSIPPGPIFAADEKTRRTVKFTLVSIDWLLKATLGAAVLGFVVSMTYFNWRGPSPVNLVISAVALGIGWFFIWGLATLPFLKLIVHPIQRMLFAASARRIDRAMVRLPLRFSLAGKWSLSTPGGLGVDSARRILFLVGKATGYRRPFLRARQIHHNSRGRYFPRGSIPPQRARGAALCRHALRQPTPMGGVLGDRNR